jgi:hypothetical protein
MKRRQRRSWSEEEERVTGCCWANRPNGPAALLLKNNKRKPKWAAIIDCDEMKYKNRKSFSKFWAVGTDLIQRKILISNQSFELSQKYKFGYWFKYLNQINLNSSLESFWNII